MSPTRSGRLIGKERRRGTSMETVTSADGTVIAYDRVGDGPVLIVCVGAFCTRTTFVAPRELARQFTVVTYDRRGRGDSGGAGPVAAERGDGAPGAGGGACGAPSGNADTPLPAVDPDERIRELVGAGRSREAVVFWMTDVVRLPEQALGQLDGAPWVTALEPLAATLPYDLAVTEGGVPEAELGKITAPVLILGGGESPAWFRRSVAEQAAATPGARLMMLDGFGHNVPPEVITPILIDFFTSRPQ